MKITTALAEQQPLAPIGSAPVEQPKELLYVTVITTAKMGDASVPIDSRVTDIAEFNSRKWLTNHQFWAIHQGHRVSIEPASEDEVNAYTNKQAQLLSRRFTRS